ncbi:MAG: hypothetical protein BGO38_06955 [Cellulomonas sp. 73-145]|uniref:hypothetical protein n=1 Tax=Cellulomonas sp. 73-145 TaxID=1895739 RepID=UPI000925E931|nr:hypothetical protein [Cellulomonas sp. 73-145]MBN9327986.1 hypothetical protein [Cellulomonas sp.]OJV57955.1 MAG: hypothetical protein BGO38_06955 [Cellulomonas sp. 73-145]
MPRTDLSAAVNATIDPVVTYHLDPRGASFVRRLAGSIGDVINGRTGQHVYAPGASFHGYARSPQNFTGAARLGTPRPIAARSSTLTAEKEASPLNAAASTLFYERMQRGRR